MRPRASGDTVLYAAKVALDSLGRRVLDLEDETAGLDELLDELVRATAPEMLELSVSASTRPPLCSSPPATTPSACARKPPGRICAAWRPSKPPRQGHPPPPGPWRRPSRQPGPVAHRHDTYRMGPAIARIHGPSDEGGSVQARSDPDLETLCRREVFKHLPRG